MLTQNLTDQFGRAALGHVTREYPTKLDHVLTGPTDLVSQREMHPIFFGSYDWHSCVHAHWLLARLLRRDPADADHVRQHFSMAFTPENVSTELAYLARPNTGTFERPYGWAWLLMLAAELQQTHPAESWAGALQPLADAFAQRFLDFLPKFTWPVRSGSHANTAFALALTVDYARSRRYEALDRAVTDAARRYYLHDAECQAWEPGGEDFLSPSLIEAECAPHPARGRIRQLVRSLPAAPEAARAAHALSSGRRQRPKRWPDRPSRRSEL